LRIADCLDQQNKHAEAAQAYRQFARLRPSHPELAYARFKAAEAELEQAPQDWLLAPPTHERDQRFTQAALRSLRSFLNDFKDSEFTEQARTLVTRAEFTLASHELYVARFYLERDEPEAAIVRLRAMLRTYEASGLEAEAMVLMGRTQIALRRMKEARTTFGEVIARFPGSGMAEQAKRYLAAADG